MGIVAFDPTERYMTTEIAGHTYLFSNLRIDRDTIPKGLYAYDVADAECDGTFARIQKTVLVNHWGTIIGKYPVPLDETGHYYPEEGTEEYEGTYGDDLTLEEYLESEE